MSANSTVILDVDSTLYDFTTPFYEELRKVNHMVPMPKYWNTWAFASSYVTKE